MRHDPGAPATFTPEQSCQIVALACEAPERLAVEISHWSQSELTRPRTADVGVHPGRTLRTAASANG